MKLMVGEQAPDFELTSHQDRNIKLSGYRGQTVVLVFFPMAWTPI